MRVPSGDHWAPEPCTSERWWVPSAFMIQTDDSHLSFILSTQRRVYSTCAPSGDSCGAWTSSQSRYCSSAMRLEGRWTACCATCCAASGAAESNVSGTAATAVNDIAARVSRGERSERIQPPGASARRWLYSAAAPRAPEGWSRSARPQGLHRLDLQRAPRGHPACRGRDQEKQRADEREGRHVRRCGVEQQLLHQSRCPDRHHRANDEAGRGQSEPLSHDEPYHRWRLGAECHANADLIESLTHAVGDDAGQTRRRDH